MLDRAKLAAAIYKSESQLWADNHDAFQLLTTTWHQIINDPLFAYRVAAVTYTPWMLPSWQEPLGHAISIQPIDKQYTIISSDGSQIYPDRHYGVASCGLINIGTVVIPYHNNGLGVRLTNEPILILSESYSEHISPIDTITIKRQEYELLYAQIVADEVHSLKAVLFDGSLIFWHLQSIVGYEVIVHRYCDILKMLENKQIPYGSYISAPKSKELLNLIRLQLCNFNPNNEAAYAPINQCTDATIMLHHLLVGHRSIFFKSNSPVTKVYPPSQQPYFCYLRHTAEIGRLELPAWLVHNTLLCDQFIGIVWDQLEKGGGYPIALAEAHEQAVVKGPDRELFYMLLEQTGARYARRDLLSQKQRHKNKPAI